MAPKAIKPKKKRTSFYWFISSFYLMKFLMQNLYPLCDVISLKGDGTSFEIYVAKNGTVADLKDAVETAFCYSPQTVSWSHVWGNFCLCYDGYKLLSDNDYISGYEIQDGDQIKFVRHVSDVNRIRKTRSERDVRDLEALNLREIISRRGEETEERYSFS
ncbi:hypothetical protein Leryth_012095 [Lithospermum erythrorhizon]|nr:hypothetical protein Leryth_012095 [Lithospermum erythrorhizon]